MEHHFTLSLAHERAQMRIADAFYRDILKVSSMKRFNSDSKADMLMQKQDVDVIIELNGFFYRISEKFRDKDYGDLYVEIFSKYPDTHGWLHTGSPNAILYFTPVSVYWITHKSLSDFCLRTFFPLIPDDWVSQLFDSHETIMHKKLFFNHQWVDLNLIQAHNNLPDGTSWETIGVAVLFSFFEQHGVKVKKWNLI